MAATMKRFNTTVSVLVLAALFGCRHTGGDHPKPPRTLDEALATGGSVRARFDGPRGAPLVVVIKDRHPVDGGRRRVEGPLREIQAVHRRLVADLVARGFDLLGCEAPLGDVTQNPAAARQRRVIHDETRADVLDERPVFQPLRYREVFGDRLRVWGVEDPELFAADVEQFENLDRARRHAARNDIPRSRRAADRQRIRSAIASIRRRVAARGRADGKNLIDLLHRFGSRRAILMIGGAHVDAACAELRREGISYRVFEARAYRQETAM